MMVRVLLLLVFLGAVAWAARQMEPDVRRYLDMSRM
ncbi:DUF6893 family small protein [Amycolatopsis rubida]|uniref:Uncharacterized protein n=1 Tax=Amycolatopsis rubida TaxID=112413 RepID=A0A1I5SF99_9PSEU|nr:hypothetical protein SAMN05421854_106298 [Amycolatopsis rubida]